MKSHSLIRGVAIASSLALSTGYVWYQARAHESAPAAAEIAAPEAPSAAPETTKLPVPHFSTSKSMGGAPVYDFGEAHPPVVTMGGGGLAGGFQNGAMTFPSSKSSVLFSFPPGAAPWEKVPASEEPAQAEEIQPSPPVQALPTAGPAPGEETASKEPPAEE